MQLIIATSCWFLLFGCGRSGGGSSSGEISGKDESLSDFSDNGSSNLDPSSNWDLALKNMIEDGMNVPLKSKHPEQGFATSTTLKMETVDKYEQVHDYIQERIGGYPNWNTVIADEDGPDAVNQEVFNLLKKIKFLEWTGAPPVAWTTEKLVESASCLTGSTPNEVGANWVEHSLCILFNGSLENEYKSDTNYWDTYYPDLEFQDGQYYHKWMMDMAFIDGQYHEYFHHFQRAHKLTADGAGDSSDEPFDPYWWAEGSGQFAGWFYRDNWKEIEFLSYLDPDHEEYDNYWERLDWSITTPNSNPPYNNLQEHLDFMVDSKNTSFFQAASKVQGVGDGNNCEGWEAKHENTSYYPDDERYKYNPGQYNCINIMFSAGPHFLAYKSSWQAALRDIPADYYELGFWGSVKKHTGLDQQKFYEEFNAILRSVDAKTIESHYAPTGWNIPDKPMQEVVDFLGIDYYKGE